MAGGVLMAPSRAGDMPHQIVDSTKNRHAGVDGCGMGWQDGDMNNNTHTETTVSGQKADHNVTAHAVTFYPDGGAIGVTLGDIPNTIITFYSNNTAREYNLADLPGAPDHPVLLSTYNAALTAFNTVVAGRRPR